MGNVLKADPTRNEILITGRSRNDAPQKVVVTEKTTLVRQVKGSAADLKVGDTIEITGIPLQIDARTIRVGEITRKPEFVPSKPLPPGAAERADRTSRLPLTRPRMLGRVLKTSPLVVQLAEGINAEIKVGAETTIIKVATIPFGSVKPGDPVFALGSRDQNGALVARRVQVGLEGFPGTGIRSAQRSGAARAPKK